MEWSGSVELEKRGSRAKNNKKLEGIRNDGRKKYPKRERGKIRGRNTQNNLYCFPIKFQSDPHGLKIAQAVLNKGFELLP